jgi:DNA-binding MarR family transcriptional regulator
MMVVMGGIDARGVAPQLFTGFLLRRAYVVTRQEVEACVEEDTNLRDFPALTLLGEVGAISQSRLAALMNLDRTTVGKLVDALEDKGWLARERDEHDRRSYALRLTETGREAHHALEALLDRGEDRLIGRLDPQERARLKAELRRLLAGDATLEIHGLGDRCAYLIARAHRMMFSRASAALVKLGLTPRDFGILTTLASNQPCTQQRLAETLGVSAPAVLGFVDELERAGLVERRRNSADRRAYDLTLTKLGRERLEAARVTALDLQAEIEHALGPSADAHLRALLAKVIGIPAVADHPGVVGPTETSGASPVDPAVA